MPAEKQTWGNIICSEEVMEVSRDCLLDGNKLRVSQ
jgi:hypothetical protein